MQAEVVRIAYAPGSYAVAWRDSYAALPSLQRQWVNTLILKKLPNLLGECVKQTHLYLFIFHKTSR